MAELWTMSATQLAALIRDRKVSVREVIQTTCGAPTRSTQRSTRS